MGNKSSFISSQKQAPLRDQFANMLASFDDTQIGDIDENAVMQDLDHALQGKRPLSEIILEERAC